MAVNSATFKIWRTHPEGDGTYQTFHTEVSDGMVVLDAVHRIQADQAPDLDFVTLVERDPVVRLAFHDDSVVLDGDAAGVYLEQVEQSADSGGLADLEGLAVQLNGHSLTPMDPSSSLSRRSPRSVRCAGQFAAAAVAAGRSIARAIARR